MACNRCVRIIAPLAVVCYATLVMAPFVAACMHIRTTMNSRRTRPQNVTRHCADFNNGLVYVAPVSMPPRSTVARVHLGKHWGTQVTARGLPASWLSWQLSDEKNNLLLKDVSVARVA